MMKSFLIFTFILSFNAFAENSRSPAVLDGSCNLDIATTYKVIEAGKEVVKEKSIEEVQKEQCKEVRKCMFSAMEEEMEELKSLEAIACNNTLTAVTTRTPGIVIDKNFDGKRKAKPNPLTDTVPPAANEKPATATTR
jgi:hypothetical protein